MQTEPLVNSQSSLVNILVSHDLAYITEAQQIPLGIVNDAAVDSIKHIKKAQDSL